jgi:hypothetical protein
MASYQVRVRNNDGEQIAVFSGGGRGSSSGGMQSLTYRKRLRTPGTGIMRIHGDDERIALLELLDTGPADTHLDYWIEFWRSDPLGGLDWYRDFVAVHRWDEFTQAGEGQIAYTVRGRGLNDLLQAEPIRWYKGSAQAAKIGACETVAKEYVDENVGPGATVVAGRDRAGTFQGLTVEVTAGTGAAWDGDRANENLLDVLVELAEFAPGDFSLEPNSYHPDTIAMEFQWRAGQWGLDKTWGNGIRPAVVFSPDNGNVENINMIFSRLEEANVCDVGGPGKGDARIYASRTSGTENDSPWARRAVFRTAAASQINSTGELEDLADATLDRQRAKRILTFNARQTTATRYGRDWDVGDLVTVGFLGRSYDKKIVGVTIGLGEGGNETIFVETEDT